MAVGNVATTEAQATPVPETLYSQMAEVAIRSCQPMTLAPPAPLNSTADSLAALSTAFTFGSILLALIALIGAIAWGFLVKVWAEREAKTEAERCARKWLEEEALPFIHREMQEFMRTFPREIPISENDVDAITAAAGQGEGG